ncbi:hypothetical protein D3C87_1612340 [compost metagenome]
MRRRILSLDRGKHRAGGLHRVAKLLAAFLFTRLPDRVEDDVVVRDGTRGARHGTAGPVGTERARRHGGDGDAQGLDLFAEAFRNAFQREFAAAVIGDSRHRDVSAHRRDVQDVAAPARAHERQHGLHHGDGAEHVHVELPAHFR